VGKGLKRKGKRDFSHIAKSLFPLAGILALSLLKREKEISYAYLKNITVKIKIHIPCLSTSR
jgi:hypothetical protein